LGSEIPVKEQSWLCFKCPSCLSPLSFPTQILDKDSIKCPFCEHKFIIRKEDNNKIYLNKDEEQYLLKFNTINEIEKAVKLTPEEYEKLRNLYSL
jgi:hypothetical protein